MKPKFLVDSVILIDHLNGIKKATKWLERYDHKEILISVITYAEILSGMKGSQEDVTYSLLNSYECLSIDPEIAQFAALLRKEHKWKLPDAFQAALATHFRLKLVTRNTKDFPSKKHKFVKIPYTL